jgi:drug/metabolite transporter (DMT)-like permease
MFRLFPVSTRAYALYPQVADRIHAVPTFALILASALWASNTVGNKAIVDDLAVSEISATRFAIGAAVMWLLVVATGQVRHLRGLGWRPVALGVMEPGIASLFIVWGLSLTSAVSATVLLSTQPVVMPLLGRLLLGEAVSGRVVAGALIAFIGTTLLVQGQSSHADGALAGDLLLACGVLLICLNQILARRIAQDHGRAVAVTALQLSAASLFCGLVLLLVERPEVPFAGFDAEVGLTLLYVGAIGGAGPFFL